MLPPPATRTPLRSGAARRALLGLVALGRVLAFLALSATLARADPPAAPAPAVAPPERAAFNLERPEIAAFVTRLVDRDHFAREQVLAVLGAAHARPELVPAMTRPAEKILDWWEYRDRYVTAKRIAGGVEFWRQHAPVLEEVGERYGIAPEYLVAILGIETNYGQVTGNYPEIDTLMTLAFDYPARDAYFRTELRQFLLLARELDTDPLVMKGSYGGALGVPQLMPSSYRRFAASAEAWRKADLWNDWSAILTSIAGFLETRGWERGGPVLLAVKVASGREPTVTGGLTLNETVGALRRRGVRIDAAIAATRQAVLIRAVLKDGAEYRVGFTNFRVISRYNPRTNYTLAVCDLASAVRERYTAP